MSQAEEEFLCYNRGCGMKYKESENTDQSCRYHSGEHFFHDAYKGWTCCRKVIDFTEFLNMKGCTVGRHSNIKPPELEKKQQTEVVVDNIEVSKPTRAALKRPSPDEELISIEKTLSDSFKKALIESSTNPSKKNSGDHKSNDSNIKCLNKGCGLEHAELNDENKICVYHPGVPIFHEGLKYWSCCQKKTIDFQVFLNQKGCATGEHLWESEETPNYTGKPNAVECRFDWHQTGTQVIVVVYAKKISPELSQIQVNGVKLRVNLIFPDKKEQFLKEWILSGIIDPKESQVLVTPMKIEITLKKAEPVKWTNLHIPDSVIENTDDINKPKSVGVDPVDLSDL